MSEIQRRYIQADKITVELRDDGAKQNATRGYAAVFNSLSVDLGGFRERLAPGCFRDALSDEQLMSDQDCKELVNHDPNLLVARTSNGSLKLTQDAGGLHHVGELIDTSTGNDLAKNIRAGLITQMSFGFTVAPDGDRWDDVGGEVVRTITACDRLYDVSPVTYPAYPATSIAMRSASSALGIDGSRFVQLLVRAERKLPIERDDRAALRDALKRLELATQEDSEEISSTHSLELRKLHARVLRLRG